jgi:shikimate dehydrogenase
LGIALTYQIVDFDRLDYSDSKLEEVVRFLAGIGWTGCNVTYPFKQAVMTFCDEVSEEAAALGAVNTLIFRDGRIMGDNTDWIGFSDMIENHIGTVAGTRVAQLGAGGAGSATAYALARLGVKELALFDPSVERCEQLAGRLAASFTNCRITVCATPAQAIIDRDGIVQTTPIGMASHPGMPFLAELMNASQWLADVIYFPAETALLAAARAKGMRAINGAAMVIGQAAAAFCLFTGHSCDQHRMLATLLPNASCDDDQ